MDIKTGAPLERDKQTAFTLIELLITLAILGILSAIAIPAYIQYTIKSKVSELIHVASAAKATVSEYRISNGAMPTTNATAGVTNIVTNYVSSLSVGAGGIITVVGNQATLGTGAAISIVLTPTYSNGAVTWTCTPVGATQYLPSTCQ